MCKIPTNEITAYLNPDFSLFNIPSPWQNALSRFPPLFSLYGKYQVNQQATNLLLQQIGKIKTEIPLLAFQKSSNRKLGIFCAQGFWRWRMYDYLEHKNHDITNSLITKAVQFLATKEDTRQFRVRLSKKSYNDSEPIRIEAELYNDNYELTNNPTATLKIVNQQTEEEFPYEFEKQNQSYSLNINYLPTGAYDFTARTNLNGKDLMFTGAFTISALKLESLTTQADHQLLFNMADKLNGQVFYPTQLAQLADSINANEYIKPVLHEEADTKPLLNLKWIFFLIVGLISTEWFIRKWNGGY